MLLNTISQVNYGEMQFFQEDGSIAFYAKFTVSNEEKSSVKIFNGKHELISEVFYKEMSRYVSRQFEVQEPCGNSFKVVSKKNYLIADCKNKEIYLVRSMLDRKMSLYVNNKLAMQMKSARLFRPWLCGKYSVDILDETYANLSVTMAMIIFKVLYDEYVLSSIHYF